MKIPKLGNATRCDGLSLAYIYIMIFIVAFISNNSLCLAIHQVRRTLDLRITKLCGVVSELSKAMSSMREALDKIATQQHTQTKALKLQLEAERREMQEERKQYRWVHDQSIFNQ